MYFFTNRFFYSVVLITFTTGDEAVSYKTQTGCSIFLIRLFALQTHCKEYQIVEKGKGYVDNCTIILSV
jgi:hypothetical protein